MDFSLSKKDDRYTVNLFLHLLENARIYVVIFILSSSRSTDCYIDSFAVVFATLTLTQYFMYLLY